VPWEWGKKSLYVTPYKQNYNEFFTAECSLIAHDGHELSAMLTSAKPLESHVIKDIDAFCDGKSAQRLYDLCLQTIGEKNNAYS